MDAVIATIVSQLDRRSPSQWIQAFYLLAAAGILVLQSLPDSIRTHLLEYGARNTAIAEKVGKNKDKNSKGKAGKDTAKDKEGSTLSWLTQALQVPHSWFWHFYALSFISSVFWAWQFLSQGSVMEFLVKKQAGGEYSIPSLAAYASGEQLGRVVVAWAMMAVQGLRRFTECMAVMKPGSSPMLVAHWVLGLGFYAVVGVAIWIESSDAILAAWASQTVPQIFVGRVPSSLAAFIIASTRQNQCHRHLASLKKYTLPTQGWFQYMVCPHYTAECIIYTVIAFVAAPPGAWFNRTVLTALAFVVANLGATAWSTKQWYAGKFGKESVESRWLMIPFVY